MYTIEKKLIGITQGNQSISEFYTQIKSVWDNNDEVNPMVYCNYGKCTCQVNAKLLQKQQEQRLLQFLMKLNDQFSIVRGHILLMQPLSSISQTFRIIVQEENHKEFSNSGQSDAMAFSATKRSFGSGNTESTNSQYSKSSSGNNNFTSNYNKKKPGSNYFCTNYKISGHNIDRCFKIHCFPAGFKQNKYKKVAAVSQSNSEGVVTSESADTSNTNGCVNSISVEQYNHLIELLNNQKIHNSATESHAALARKTCLMTASFSSIWLLDSGATDHICPNLTDFSEYKAITTSDNKITIPDGK